MITALVLCLFAGLILALAWPWSDEETERYYYYGDN